MAYALRDAFAAAETFPSESEVANLKNKFKIKIKHDYLIFEPQQKLEFGEAEMDSPSLVLARSLETMQIDEVKGVLEIVGAIIKHKAPEFIFPDATLDEGEMDRLVKWLNISENYIFIKSSPLTIRKRDTIENNSTEDGGLKLG